MILGLPMPDPRRAPGGIRRTRFRKGLAPAGAPLVLPGRTLADFQAVRLIIPRMFRILPVTPDPPRRCRAEVASRRAGPGQGQRFTEPNDVDRAADVLG